MSTMAAPVLGTVECEALRLDRLSPNWARKIDTQNLRLESYNSCILGQVYGNYWNGWPFVASDVGASVGQNVIRLYCYPEYEPQWITEIEKRTRA